MCHTKIKNRTKTNFNRVVAWIRLGARHQMLALRLIMVKEYNLVLVSIYWRGLITSWWCNCGKCREALKIFDKMLTQLSLLVKMTLERHNSQVHLIWLLLDITIYLQVLFSTFNWKLFFFLIIFLGFRLLSLCEIVLIIKFSVVFDRFNATIPGDHGLPKTPNG